MFKGLGQLGNMVSALRQAQEMGPKMQGMAEELRNRRFEGASADGAVRIELNGVPEALGCRVDRQKVTTASELESDILEAINRALAQVQLARLDQMKALAGDIKLPGMDQAMSDLMGGGR